MAFGSKRRALFLSFDYDDVERVDEFRNLKWDPDIQLMISDRSIKSRVHSQNHLDVKDAVLRQLHGSSVCVCLVGRKTFMSRWVGWEVRTAADEGRTILGIRLQGCERAQLPKCLVELDARVLGWEPHTFNDEIDRAARLYEARRILPFASPGSRPVLF